MSSITNAITAPTASISRPSASRIVETVRLTLSRRNSGVMTVGPETITSEPNRIEVVQSQSVTHLV